MRPTGHCLAGLCTVSSFFLSLLRCRVPRETPPPTVVAARTGVLLVLLFFFNPFCLFIAIEKVPVPSTRVAWRCCAFLDHRDGGAVACPNDTAGD